MRQEIIKTLKENPEILDWSIRRISSREGQSFYLPSGLETERLVEREHYDIDLLKENRDSNGASRCGRGNTTLLVGDEVGSGVREALLRAGMVNNPLYRFPKPSDPPKVALVDEALLGDRFAAMDDVYENLLNEVNKYPGVRMTSAELFLKQKNTTLVNSRGLEAEQNETQIYLEYVLITGGDGDKVESFVALKRKRIADLNLQDNVAVNARNTLDLLVAKRPGAYNGPVVLKGAALVEFMTANMLKVLTSAEMKYNKLSPWEIGQPILPGDAKGDALTLWANRLLPYGADSNRFDSEGIPAQKVLLIEDGRLVNYTADSQYGSYLSIPLTGGFGNVEVAPGSKSAQELTSDDHVEIVSFSWFTPDIISGDFASEIRLGYLVSGRERRPFKGGMLVGNALTALTDVYFSQETGFSGNYQGPTTVRFGELTVAAGG
ncbi:MAG: metallopeptidase TldD-related protein [Anaerolineales bacterium]|jgi:predicted Zn-dependent protease